MKNHDDKIVNNIYSYRNGTGPDVYWSHALFRITSEKYILRA